MESLLLTKLLVQVFILRPWLKILLPLSADLISALRQGRPQVRRGARRASSQLVTSLTPFHLHCFPNGSHCFTKPALFNGSWDSFDKLPSFQKYLFLCVKVFCLHELIYTFCMSVCLVLIEATRCNRIPSNWCHKLLLATTWTLDWTCVFHKNSKCL